MSSTATHTLLSIGASLILLFSLLIGLILVTVDCDDMQDAFDDTPNDDTYDA